VAIEGGRMRLLLVDDDPSLRRLLAATFEGFEVGLTEAGSASEALAALSGELPDAVVLDVAMPGVDGLTLCRQLKSEARTREIPVVLLTGSDTAAAAARSVGAEGYVRKPFRPLELLAVIERLAGVRYGVPIDPLVRAESEEEQLLLYAHDLRHLLDLERSQRLLVQAAYRETIGALASALESKDTGTRAHSQRVQHYAALLTRIVAPRLLDDPSTEYGFLLHDVGKIGIPDEVLRKPRPLAAAEERLMRTHTLLGEQMLSGIGFLQGEGLRVVRSHHERWDGRGYPDGLVREQIPQGARIFAVADTLDAITSARPYRQAGTWAAARTEIFDGAGTQFDPDVVAAFRESERELVAIRRELSPPPAPSAPRSAFQLV
jgi:response regulator RpfG family c-di-GMP phosphodiesterase